MIADAPDGLLLCDWMAKLDPVEEIKVCTGFEGVVAEDAARKRNVV